MIGNFLGNFEKPHSYGKTAVATFWATLETFGLLFTLTSGHTACQLKYLNLNSVNRCLATLRLLSSHQSDLEPSEPKLFFVLSPYQNVILKCTLGLSKKSTL